MHRFSVVISVYNKEKYIASTLQSVLHQSIQDFEIVILNDGSTDNSEAQIKPFLKDPRIRFFSEENKGAGAGRNFVIQNAKAPYIALLDADDVWHPSYLKEINDLINAHPKESVFATASKIQKGSNSYARSYSVDNTADSPLILNYFESSLLDSTLHSSTSVIRRSVFDEVGFYDTSIKSGQDTDLYVRIGLRYPVVFSPKVCVTYRVLDDSLFRTTKKVEDKPNFKNYESYEDTNLALKKFLDLNRYSLCLLAKLEDNIDAYNEIKAKISLANLNRKQRFLLRQDPFILKNLFRVKSSLSNLGIRLSAFK